MEEKTEGRKEYSEAELFDVLNEALPERPIARDISRHLCAKKWNTPLHLATLSVEGELHGFPNANKARVILRRLVRPRKILDHYEELFLLTLIDLLKLFTPMPHIMAEWSADQLIQEGYSTWERLQSLTPTSLARLDIPCPDAVYKAVHKPTPEAIVVETPSPMVDIVDETTMVKQHVD